MFERVLVAYDGSEGARRALEVEEERRFEKQACSRLLKEAAAYASEQA